MHRECETAVQDAAKEAERRMAYASLKFRQALFSFPPPNSPPQPAHLLSFEKGDILLEETLDDTSQTGTEWLLGRIIYSQRKQAEVDIKECRQGFYAASYTQPLSGWISQEEQARRRVADGELGETSAENHSLGSTGERV